MNPQDTNPRRPVATNETEEAQLSPTLQNDPTALSPEKAQISQKPSKKSPRKLVLICISIIIIAGLAGGSIWLLSRNKKNITETPPTSTQQKADDNTAAQNLPGIQLDPKKNYGDKYADGLLPVGDSKYDTKAAKAGAIYACQQYAQSFSQDRGGAGSRGPWFTNNNTQYDINKKARVSGSVHWDPKMANNVSGSQRIITTNDLPDHPTGIFPIGSADPAYAYDRNPNSISEQSLTYTLTGTPQYGTPQCIGGEVGIMLTGVALFSAFDAGGRDAGAWEVQDDCGGHPQNHGEYHYHTLSSCISDIKVDHVIGFALDGFPITGPTIGDKNILTTSDLDECHGITSEITLDGKKTTMYHYVMTQDFPYSVSCYRATAAQPPH
jgi:hypothetical protein